jgi:hypothetical protein
MQMLPPGGQAHIFMKSYSCGPDVSCVLVCFCLRPRACFSVSSATFRNAASDWLMDAYPTAVVHASKVWVPEQNIAQSTDYFAFRVARHSRISYGVNCMCLCACKQRIHPEMAISWVHESKEVGGINISQPEHGLLLDHRKHTTSALLTYQCVQRLAPSIC